MRLNSPRGVESARFLASPSCALVRRKDGSLHWRPYPDSRMIFLRGSVISYDGFQFSDDIQGMDCGPVPPPLDYYFSLDRVELSDEVKTSFDASGRIVAVIARHEYDALIDKVDWEYLGHGFLIASAGSGSLTWYEEADEDLELLHRRDLDVT